MNPFVFTKTSYGIATMIDIILLRLVIIILGEPKYNADCRVQKSF